MPLVPCRACEHQVDTSALACPQCGATDPAKAAPGTIRKLFGANVGENATHGSDSLENAKGEIAYFFPSASRYPSRIFRDTFAPSAILSASGQTTGRTPTLIEFRKKIRANDRATTTLTPAPIRARGACSRDEPQPKLLPATTTSPG